MKRKTRPGRILEAVVASIERVLGQAPNVSVESPAFLPDRVTGDLREHDVLITISESHHKVRIPIECRDRSRKITVNDIESFKSKCDDTGVDHGVMVSPKGFTKSAFAKAVHYGIRCLLLAEATSFNWLGMSGMRAIARHIKNVEWKFGVEGDLLPDMSAFSVLDTDGGALDTTQLRQAAINEFGRIPENGDCLGEGEKRIIFNTPGVRLRDATGTEFQVAKAIAVVQYQVVEEFFPFRLVKYSDTGSGELITDAAIADVKIGEVSGKIMIVYKEDEGGQVVFMAEKAEGAEKPAPRM